MSNFLNVGLEIMRVDGTCKTYWGWTLSQVESLERDAGYDGDFRVLHRVYEIENNFARFEYMGVYGDTPVFRHINDPAREITELETESGIAHYIWNLAVEADEDSVRAYKLMAVDIFDDFEKWRAMAFWHIMQDFERDVDYLKEVTA